METTNMPLASSSQGTNTRNTESKIELQKCFDSRNNNKRSILEKRNQETKKKTKSTPEYNVPTQNKYNLLEEEEEQMEAQDVILVQKSIKKPPLIVFATKIINHGAMLDLLKEKAPTGFYLNHNHETTTLHVNDQNEYAKFI